jgi:hypothetical protein
VGRELPNGHILVLPHRVQVIEAWNILVGINSDQNVTGVGLKKPERDHKGKRRRN